MLAVWTCQTDSADILWEQFEYLMAHAESKCDRGETNCGDCRRVARVVEILMEPFRVKGCKMNVRGDGGDSSNRAASE